MVAFTLSSRPKSTFDGLLSLAEACRFMGSSEPIVGGSLLVASSASLGGLFGGGLSLQGELPRGGLLDVLLGPFGSVSGRRGSTSLSKADVIDVSPPNYGPQ